MEITDDRVYILENDRLEALLVFDRHGKFLLNIGKKGRGPGEYYTINDFFINERDEEIAIYDGNMREIHHYDQDGHHLRTHAFENNWLFACHPLDSSRHALDYTKRAGNRNPFHLRLVDSSGQAYFNYKPLKRDYYYANNHHIAFYKAMNGLFYTPALCDTIFTLSPAGITGGYAIDFGKQRLPEFFFDMLDKNEHATALLKSSYCHRIRNVLETERLLSFNFGFGSIELCLFYDKLTGETFQNIQFLPPPRASRGNLLAGTFNSENLHTLVHNMPEAYIEQWKNVLGADNWQLLTEISLGDNPLLFFYDITPPPAE
jgi:hypothetical protein